MGRPKFSALGKEKWMKGNCSLAHCQCCAAWRENSIHPNPKKADLCQIPFEDAAGLGIGPSLEMLRFLSLGGHSSSPWNFTGDEQVKPAKTKFYRVGKCSKLYQKLFSACQKLSAQCQRVAISASPIFLVLHCAS